MNDEKKKLTVVSFNCDTGKTEIIERQIEDVSACPAEIAPVPPADFGEPEAPEMSPEAKAALARAGLLKSDGTIDEDAYFKLPTADELKPDSGFQGKDSYTDNRTLLDSYTYPYSSVVYILFEIPGAGRYRGSGVVVGKRVVLTCGHCVCQTGQKLWHRNTVVWGRVKNGRKQVVAYYQTQVVGIDYFNGVNRNDDWAIIVTRPDGPLNNLLGSLGVVTPFPQLPVDILASGYPSSVKGKDYQKDLYGAPGKLEYIHNNGINGRFFDAVVSGGQSGGPIMYKNGTQQYKYTIGVIYAGNAYEPRFMADSRIIDLALYQEINKWVNDPDRK